MSKIDLIKGVGSNPNALKTLQGYSLPGKIAHTQRKIAEWYEFYHGNVYVSFSGGKDSTVLLHLARSMFPDIEAVFSDTGLEFPEIREFIKTIENVTWVKPKLSFKQVLEKYGYPIISKEQSCYIDQYRNTKNEYLKSVRFNGKEGYKNKRVGKISEKWKYLIDAPFKISDRCCYVLKKNPIKSYEKKSGKYPIIGTMAQESAIRAINYNRNGCNAYSLKRPVSCPISFWNEDDIWAYIKLHDLKYCSVYDMGYARTGCVFCMFGLHLEKEDRLKKLSETHPSLFKYCMEKLDLKTILKWYPRRAE
jgi:3'-phosphoadenosine 5'-phosphosulfate sulfotransferase (PAPS reductase)/FAD synthetase